MYISPDNCGPGYYSTTGVAKCFTCPIGTYSSEERNKACISCPSGTGTVISAAKGIEDCGSTHFWQSKTTANILRMSLVMFVKRTYMHVSFLYNIASYSFFPSAMRPGNILKQWSGTLFAVPSRYLSAGNWAYGLPALSGCEIYTRYWGEF